MKPTAIDLYTVLGVARDVDAAGLLSAYRKAAMEAHPDHGGSAEKFATLKRAYDVLKDPERRARYDADGSIDEEPDRVEEEALTAIGFALQSIIEGAEPFEKAPVLDSIAREFKRMQAKIDEALRDLGRQKKRATKMQKRLRRKGDGTNLLVRMIDNKILHLDTQEKRLQLERSVMVRAIEILSDYEFTMDKPPETATKTQLPGLFSSSTIFPTDFGA